MRQERPRARPRRRRGRASPMTRRAASGRAPSESTAGRAGAPCVRDRWATAFVEGQSCGGEISYRRRAHVVPVATDGVLDEPDAEVLEADARGTSRVRKQRERGQTRNG